MRVAIIGGGPAGSFFALYALKYARLAGRDLSLTIYEYKDFARRGPVGCNMCAGLIPAHVVHQLDDLDLVLPPALLLGRIGHYALHTWAGVIDASPPDASAEVFSVFRGAGPCAGPRTELVSFDQFLLDEAVARGAVLRRAHVDNIRRETRVEVSSSDGCQQFDLVVLAGGVNGRAPTLEGFRYAPPPTTAMCQSELYLGEEQVQARLGTSVHIFLPPDDVAACGMLIPKGPFVTVSLLHARNRMRSLHQFLAQPEVVDILGVQAYPICGCLPRISIGAGQGLGDDGLVAVGDGAVTRLYKNGIGSALATARQAAWTAIQCGVRRADFAQGYLPLCRSIVRDNRAGQLLLLQVPALKHVRALALAHRSVGGAALRDPAAAELHARILWGTFTGAYSYTDLLRMAVRPSFVRRFAFLMGQSLLGSHVDQPAVRAPALGVRRV